MALSSSAEGVLAPADLGVMFAIAESAIIEGLRGRRPSTPSLESLTPSLREPRGVFVTLTVDDELNGCIGSLSGEEPLGQGVARHAWSAAFADPRLPALRWSDWAGLVIEVSVLSPLEEIPARTRREVIEEIRPGVDGVLISAGARRGVFLPAVWEQLPEPEDFLDHLLLKAGMSSRSWPEGMEAWRFTARKYSRHTAERAASSSAG